MKTNIHEMSIRFVLLIFVIWCLGGCQENFSGARFDSQDKMQIYDYVKEHPSLSIYKELLDYTGFSSQMSTAGTYTAFIPDNEAFAMLFKRLEANGEKITKIADKTPEYWLNYMKYHTVAKILNSNTFENGILEEPTLLGKEYYIISDIRESYSAIKLNSISTIKEYNIKVANGLIQIIDQVLLPPTKSVYDMLVEAGVYKTMLKIFDENGLTDYLKDSIVTVMVEPDYVLKRDGFDASKIKDIGNWADYHVIYNERSFTGALNGRSVYPLYPEESITFSIDKEGKMWCNKIFGFSTSLVNGMDNVALNGVYHTLDTTLAIVEAPPGIKRHNLYAKNTDTYEQNVFTEAPAAIVEDFGSQSYHQGKKAPIVSFDAQQIGDYFYTTIPDVAAGTYQVRMIYRTGNRANLMMIYNNEIISNNLIMDTADGNWAEWTSLQQKNCGVITVSKRGAVKLYFQVVLLKRAPSGCCDLLMDMIELIPQ